MNFNNKTLVNLFLVCVVLFGIGLTMDKVFADPMGAGVDLQKFPTCTAGHNYYGPNVEMPYDEGDTIRVIPTVCFDGKTQHKPSGKLAITISEKWPSVEISVKSIVRAETYARPDSKQKYVITNEDMEIKYKDLISHLESYGYLASMHQGINSGVIRIYIY